jgi:hypothetical protein
MTTEVIVGTVQDFPEALPDRLRGAVTKALEGLQREGASNRHRLVHDAVDDCYAWLVDVWRDGSVLAFDLQALPPAIAGRALSHGIGQKLPDAFSDKDVFDTDRKRRAVMVALWQSLCDSQWDSRGSATVIWSFDQVAAAVAKVKGLDGAALDAVMAPYNPDKATDDKDRKARAKGLAKIAAIGEILVALESAADIDSGSALDKLLGINQLRYSHLNTD